MINTIRSLNLSPYGTRQRQNLVVPARSLWPGSDLTSHHSLLVSRLPFRSTSYVLTKASQTSHSLIPYTAHGCSRTSYPAGHLNPRLV
jgi:hypothetical protein